MTREGPAQSILVLLRPQTLFVPGELYDTKHSHPSELPAGISVGIFAPGVSCTSWRVFGVEVPPVSSSRLSCRGRQWAGRGLDPLLSTQSWLVVICYLPVAL